MYFQYNWHLEAVRRDTQSIVWKLDKSKSNFKISLFSLFHFKMKVYLCKFLQVTIFLYFGFIYSQKLEVKKEGHEREIGKEKFSKKMEKKKKIVVDEKERYFESWGKFNFKEWYHIKFYTHLLFGKGGKRFTQLRKYERRKSLRRKKDEGTKRNKENEKIKIGKSEYKWRSLREGEAFESSFAQVVKKKQPSKKKTGRYPIYSKIIEFMVGSECGGGYCCCCCPPREGCKNLRKRVAACR